MIEKTSDCGSSPLLQPISIASHLLKRWRIFTACAAGETFLLYAILIAHTLRPVTALLIDQNSHRMGASGRYQYIFNRDGLIPTMLGSLFVVAAVCSASQLTDRAIPGTLVILSERAD